MGDLWKVDHPYYAAEGNRVRYDSFWEYLQDWEAVDDDLNLVYRWDIRPPRNERGEAVHPESDLDRVYELRITRILQRKSDFQASVIKVARRDEKDIVKHLKERWDHLKKVWEGISEVDLRAVEIVGDLWEEFAMRTTHPCTGREVLSYLGSQALERAWDLLLTLDRVDGHGKRRRPLD